MSKDTKLLLKESASVIQLLSNKLVNMTERLDDYGELDEDLHYQSAWFTELITSTETTRG